MELFFIVNTLCSIIISERFNSDTLSSAPQGSYAGRPPSLYREGYIRFYFL